MSGHVVWVEFLITPGQERAFTRRVQQQARDSLEKEPGCRRFDVCVDPNNPARIVLYEIYSDQAAFAVHLASDHFKDFDAQVRNLIEHKSVRRFSLLP